MAIQLTTEQKAAVEDRGGDLLVAAAAGSGKTRVLVERLMAYIESGKDIDKFLVITFTNAAAAELRSRVAEAIQSRQAMNPGDSHLRRNASLVFKAHIGTIDSFCLDFLRHWGYLADVDPDFRICDRSEAEELRQRALEETLEGRYSNIANDPGFAALADTMADERSDQTLESIILEIFDKVQSQADPIHWLMSRRDAFLLTPGTPLEETPWGKLLIEDAKAEVRHWLHALKEELEHIQSTDSILTMNIGKCYQELISGLQALNAALGQGWDAAAKAFPVSDHSRMGSKKGADPQRKERAAALRNECKDRMKDLQSRFSVSSKEALEDLEAVGPSMAALLEAVVEFNRRFMEKKKRRHLLEFNDASHITASLLLDSEGNPTALAQEVGADYEEIMLDEYQDTNPVQNAIFSSLASVGRLFMVGDVKQSIYRFRLADPTIFLEKYNTFPLAPDAQEHQPRKLLLSANFRSRPEVLDAVNYIFKGIMTVEAGELDYTDAEALRKGREDLTPDSQFATEFIAIDLSDVAPGTEETERTSKDLLEARAAAYRIRGLLDSGMELSGRPIQPEDIVILLRSVNPVLHQYIKALEELQIPWSAEGGPDFFGSTEISVMISLLSVLDNPYQDVPLLSVLRSPVFAFSADRLAQIRSQYKLNTTVWESMRAAAEAHEEDCAHFVSQIQQFRSLVSEFSSHQLIWELYGKLDIPAIFGAMPEGALRRANLMALYDEAVRFESSGHRGLMAFLLHLSRKMENDPYVEVPTGITGGVRIMSIHKSKGLQFPVVLLCGLERQFNLGDLNATVLFHPDLGLGPKRTDRSRMLRYTTVARDAVALRLHQQMRAEEMRLLYVAMTRAEHKLILLDAIKCHGVKSFPLKKAALQAEYPPEPRSMALGDCMSDWVLPVVMSRTDSGELWKDLELEPFAAPPQQGLPWTVAMWSGNELDYDTQQAAPAAGIPAGTIPLPPDVLDQLTWQYPYQEASNVPSALTVTELKGREKDFEVSKDSQELRVRSRSVTTLRRPVFEENRELTPAERGTALHMVMQYIDFRCTDTEEHVRQEVQRLVDHKFITPRQGLAVDPQDILKLFASPLGQALLSSPKVEREYKFAILVPASDFYPGTVSHDDRLMLHGVVDCWYTLPDGSIAVVDFKTDHVTEDNVDVRASDYYGQVEAYSKALTRILKVSVSKRSLWFFSLGREYLL